MVDGLYAYKSAQLASICIENHMYHRYAWLQYRWNAWLFMLGIIVPN